MSNQLLQYVAKIGFVFRKWFEYIMDKKFACFQKHHLHFIFITIKNKISI